MNIIKVAAASLNQTPMHWRNNFENITGAIEEGKKQNVSILCLPELCISGYGCEDAFLSPFIIDNSLSILKKILPHTSNIFVTIGLPLSIDKSLYNAVALVADKKILGFVLKRFLAGYGVHYENRWFNSWPKNEIKEIEIDKKIYFAGDLIFNINGIKIGIEICEDAWNVDRPAREFAAYNVDIILNPSASHFAFGKLDIRKQLVKDSARFCNAYYVYANLNGCEAGRIIYDGGSLIASPSKILNQGIRFSFKPFSLTYANIDIDQNKIQKTKRLSSSEVLKRREIKSLMKLKKIKITKEVFKVEEWELSKEIKKEEFTRCVGLGLYDYLRKTKSSGFIVSLSGGVDSGACAILIYYMVLAALKELSDKAFETLNLKNKTDSSFIMRQILTTVYQASNNSGFITLDAAKTLSKAINATFYKLNISTIINEYISMIEKSIKRKLTWKNDDKALQNIQARVRGPSVWLFANIKNALLLTTSNRSEAAVGYATMDGDTCGGLCPLGGIDKPFLIEWIKWIEKEGPIGFHNIKEVNKITKQAPTAELRPPSEKQEDEKDLMPYYILDLIEKSFVREKKSPKEIYDSLYNDIENEYDKKHLKNYINKFLSLWNNNQWKRERYAPSFHVDDESLDPKSSLRYPILSGKLEIDF